MQPWTAMMAGVTPHTLELALYPIVPDDVRKPVIERITATAISSKRAIELDLIRPVLFVFTMADVVDVPAVESFEDAPSIDLRWPGDVAPDDVANWLSKHAPNREVAAGLQREL